MKKTLEILQHEIVTLVSRFSFWFGIFGVPLISVLLLLGIDWLNRSQADASGEAAVPSPLEQIGLERPEDTRPIGYIDSAGLIQLFPDGNAPTGLIHYTDPAEADRDLRDGDIRSYTVIDPGYVNTGLLTVYTPEFDLISADEGTWQLVQILEYNMLSGDLLLAEAVGQPLAEVVEVNVSPQADRARDRDEEAAFFLPYATMFLFYMGIMGSSGLLLNSVSKEKENRIIEVLMSSVTPRQMLYGKIIGLGLVGLLQIMVWAGTAFMITRMGVNIINIPPEFELQPSILFWGALFFIFGYLVYASLMAGVGALVPSLREASQATIIVVLPMMIPMMLISVLITSPDGPLAVAMSLIPFTASTTMMLRLAATDVPLWQLLLSLAILALTSLLVIRAVAGLFRAQVLLSGQTFNIKRFFLALMGK